MGFEFIGHKYNEGEKGSASKALEKWAKDARQPIEGELEKTDEEIKMIEAVNTLLKSELKRLGIETFEAISSDQIHFLSAEVFEKTFPDNTDSALFKATNNAIYIHLGRSDTKARLFVNLLHECIHAASKKKFYRSADNGISDARVGYRLYSKWKGETIEQRKLKGFNEIMNVLTEMKILFTHDKELMEFGISREDVRGPIYPYGQYQTIAIALIKKIASQKNIDFNEAFDLLERGQFTDNILNLKEIGEAFGKESLKILSYLGSFKDEEKGYELDKMVIKYFITEDEKERIETASKISQFMENLKENPFEEQKEIVE